MHLQDSNPETTTQVCISASVHSVFTMQYYSINPYSVNNPLIITNVHTVTKHVLILLKNNCPFTLLHQVKDCWHCSRKVKILRSLLKDLKPFYSTQSKWDRILHSGSKSSQSLHLRVQIPHVIYQVNH